MFLRQIVAAFFARTSPASSMQKPAAMNITTMPVTRKDRVLKINTDASEATGSSGAASAASCANARAGAKAARAAPHPAAKVSFFFMMISCFLFYF